MLAPSSTFSMVGPTPVAEGNGGSGRVRVVPVACRHEARLSRSRSRILPRHLFDVGFLLGLLSCGGR